MSTWTPAHRETTSPPFGSNHTKLALAAALTGMAVLFVVLEVQLSADAFAPGWQGFALLVAALSATGVAALLVRPGRASAVAAHPAPPATGIVETGSISSDVTLDYDAGTATKVYRPTLPVKLLYALSFQSAFPYTTNESAFVAAAERRAIAGLLTDYWFGENHVAQVLAMPKGSDGRFRLVTELVRGTPPKDVRAARTFLTALQRHFEDAGLPPWQVASYNPRATGNIIEQTNGAYRIIDLESNLVSPFLRPRVLWHSLRAGLYPSFDEINTNRLNGYLAANRERIEARLGSEKAASLLVSAANYEVAQRAWHAGERRYASKLLRLATAIIDLPGMVRGLRRIGQGGERLADGIAESGIRAWVDEGLMTAEEAASARASLAAPEMTSATASLGAHLAMSVPLRFPFGSIARIGWTVAARLKGEVAGLRKQQARREARRVHSAPVALLGAIPGFGAFAYLAAKPFREQRVLRAVLFDQSLRHAPFGLHSKLHLSALGRWMALPPGSGAATGPSRETLTARAWPVVAAAVVAGAAWSALDTAVLGGATGTRLAYGAVALAGIPALLAFREFWKRDNRGDAAALAGSFLWAVIGVGALIAGADLAFALSESAAALLEGLNLPLVPGAEETATLALAAYAFTGIGAGYLFRHELLAGRASSSALAAALAVTGAAFALEATGVAVTGVTVSGAALLAMAGGLRLAELSRGKSRAGGHFARAYAAFEAPATRFARVPQLTAVLVGVSAVVAAVSLGVSYLAAPGMDEPVMFRDFGAVTLYSSLMMLAAGTFGISAWWRDCAASGRALGGDLWAMWGLAFAILAFDATPDVHGHLGGMLAAATGSEGPLGFHRWSDAIVGVYGLAGVAISVVLWRQLLEHPRAILRFAGAVPFAMLSVAVDGFASHGWTLTLLEEGAELMAIAFFVSGFAQRYRESADAGAKLAAFPRAELQKAA